MAHGIDTPQAIQKVNEENKKKKPAALITAEPMRILMTWLHVLNASVRFGTERHCKALRVCQQSKRTSLDAE